MSKAVDASTALDTFANVSASAASDERTPLSTRNMSSSAAESRRLAVLDRTGEVGAAPSELEPRFASSTGLLDDDPGQRGAGECRDRVALTCVARPF